MTEYIRLTQVPSVQSAAVEALSGMYLEFRRPGARRRRHQVDAGQLDWRRACLIGNYFMSAISGVQSSLNAAALAAKRYREKEYAENKLISSRWGEKVKRPGVTSSDFLGAIVRNPAAQEGSRYPDRRS